MIDPDRFTVALINERYRDRRLGKSPWESLPDDNRERWLKAVERVFAAHGLLPAGERPEEPLEGQLALFGDER